MGEATIEVVIEFDSFASGVVKQRTWHLDQQIEDLADGGIILTVKVAVRAEVECGVLEWGGAGTASPHGAGR